MGRCKSPTQPPARRRLHGKQSGQEHRAVRVRCRRQTALGDAVRAGLVPKARRAFALFTQHSSAGVRPGSEHMRTIAARWRALSASERRQWQEAAAKERREQLQAASALGVHIRGGPRARKATGGLTTVAPSPDHNLAASPNSILFGDFRVEPGEPVGQGSYGKVVRARHMGSLQIVVLKIGSEAGGADILKELEVYKVLREQCPALAPFQQLLDGNCEPPCPWMALPYLESGNLRCHILGKRAVNIEAVALQLGWGLWHLHSRGILHLDVKPSNLLWNPVPERLVIIDFGCSERFNPQLGYVTTLTDPECEEVVTAQYRAPELWLDAPMPVPPRLLCPATDVWSYGCVLHEVLAGRLMFDTRSTLREWCMWHDGSRPQSRKCAAIRGGVPDLWWPVIWHACHPRAKWRPTFANDVMGVLAELRAHGARPTPAEVCQRRPPGFVAR